MSVLLIDTNIYSGLMKGDPVIKDILKRADHLYFPFIVIGELLFGFKLGTKQQENTSQLEDFLLANRTTILYPDEELPRVYSAIAAELRKNGTPIPTNDIWIAAFARQYEYPIFTLDGDFRHIDGIRIVSDTSSFEEL